MRFRKCVGALLLPGLLAACGNRDPGGFHPSGQAPAGGPTTASSAGDTNPGGDATPAPGDSAVPKTPQSALAAYRSYQLAYEQAYQTNDPSVLAPVAMDPLLKKVATDIAGVRAQGLIWRFHNVLNPRIQGTSGDGSTVVILDCVETIGAYKFSAKTGKRLSAWRGGTAQYQATMRYTDDTWKISEATEGGKC